jgi:hypothetical protein
VKRDKVAKEGKLICITETIVLRSRNRDRSILPFTRVTGGRLLLTLEPFKRLGKLPHLRHGHTSGTLDEPGVKELLLLVTHTLMARYG